METLIAIDPGVKISGWALFASDGRLDSCGVARSKSTDDARAAEQQAGQIPTAAVAVVELMHPRGDDTRSRTAEILRVQWVGGFLAGRLGLVARAAPPHEWKGSVPKHIHHPRILARLDDGELRVMDSHLSGLSSKVKHNAIDAIGIGLWALGRRA
jgi:hypothetical protein